MKKNKEQFDKVQARYKKNCDVRLRNQSEVIPEDGYVYLMVGQRILKDHNHKLAPVDKGSSKVTGADTHAVIIER